MSHHPRTPCLVRPAGQADGGGAAVCGAGPRRQVRACVSVRAEGCGALFVKCEILSSCQCLGLHSTAQAPRTLAHTDGHTRGIHALAPTPSHHLYSVRAISFSADGALLATGSNDRTVSRRIRTAHCGLNQVKVVAGSGHREHHLTPSLLVLAAACSGQ